MSVVPAEHGPMTLTESWELAAASRELVERIAYEFATYTSMASDAGCLSKNEDKIKVLDAIREEGATYWREAPTRTAVKAGTRDKVLRMTRQFETSLTLAVHVYSSSIGSPIEM